MGAIRILHIGPIMRMNMHVVSVPEGGIVVRMDLDDRYACADNDHDEEGKHCPAGTFAECAQTAHSAKTVPDSRRLFKRLCLKLAICRYSPDRQRRCTDTVRRPSGLVSISIVTGRNVSMMPMFVSVCCVGCSVVNRPPPAIAIGNSN